MRHRVTIVRVATRKRDDDLQTDVVRGVGFRAVCSCGYRSPVRQTVRLARVEGATRCPVSVG